MAGNDPCVVVLQLTGGNDYLNTMIPYNNPLYRDNRPAVGIADDHIIHLDKDYGIPDYMAPMKKFWDDKKLAVLHGVGFKDSPRSHFRAMDIWHTCEPEKVGTEGWLGRVAREFDPNKENVVQVVSMGPSLPRSGDGLPQRDRNRFSEGRGHHQSRAAEVLLDGGVPEHADCPQAQGHRADAHRRDRQPDVLLRSQHLRHACRAE